MSALLKISRLRRFLTPLKAFLGLRPERIDYEKEYEYLAAFALWFYQQLLHAEMVAWQNDFITYLMTYYPFFGDKELPDGVDYDDVFGLWCLLGRYRRSDFPAGKSNVVYQVEKLKKEIEKLTEEKQALADQLLQERDDKWLEQKLRTCGSMLELVNKAVATADTANIASMKERIQQLEAENNKLKKRKRRC